jgi:hypothetical protein
MYSAMLVLPRIETVWETQQEIHQLNKKLDISTHPGTLIGEEKGPGGSKTPNPKFRAPPRPCPIAYSLLSGVYSPRVV